MKLYSTETIPNKNIEALEMVTGNAVYAVRIDKSFMIGINAIGGGVLDDVTGIINTGKEVAKVRLQIAARNLNADAIVAVRANTSFESGFVHVEYYGTAVKIL